MKLATLKKLTVGSLYLPIYGDDEKALSVGISTYYVSAMDFKAAIAGVRGANVEIKENGLSHEWFTPFASLNPDYAPRTYLPTPVLPKGMRKIIKSFAATRDVRYYMCGAFFNLERSEVVATDGHRMAVIPMAGIDCTSLAGNRIVPVAPLMDAETFKGFFPVDGVYPDYRRVIPGNDWLAKYRVQLDCDSIKYYLDKKVKYNGLILSDGLIARSSTDDRLQHKSIGSVISTEGKLPEKYGYNVQYLLDVAGACKEEYVTAYFYEGAMKVEKDDGTLFVVMMMRV